MTTYTINLFMGASNTAMQTGTLQLDINQGFCIDLLAEPIAFNAVGVELGGFDHSQLHFNACVNGEDLVFYLPDAQQQQALLKAIPPHIRISGLKAHQQQASLQKWVWRGVISMLVVLAMAAVLMVLNYDRAVGWVANQVSLETEQKIGKKTLDSIAESEAIIKSGAAYTLVDRVGKQVSKGSKYPYQFYVSASPQVNAFALPGGFVVVNAGLLRIIDNPNELAAVIAHEVQHVEQKHSLKNAIGNLGFAALMLAVLGDANSAVIVLTQQLAAQSYSRGIESEADRLGFYLMRKQGIPTTAMATMLQKLEAQAEKQDSPVAKGSSHQTLDPNAKPDKADGNNTDKATQEKEKEKGFWSDIFASHPDTGKRVAEVKALIKSHPCVNCRSISWDYTAVMQDLLLIKKEQKEQQTAQAPEGGL